MSKRLPGVLVMALLASLMVGLLSLGPPALAVEEGEEPPGPVEVPELGELMEGRSDRAIQFAPPDYEQPSPFPWLFYPILGLGLLVVGGLLLAYLVWMPRFAEERRSKQRR